MNLPTINPYSEKNKHERKPRVALDEALLNELWTNNFAALVYYASQIVKSNLISEDIVSIAFTKLWTQRENFDNIPSMRSFLYVTVKNSCFDHLRSQEIHDRIHQDIIYVSDYVQEINRNDYNMMYAEYIQQLHVEIRELPEGCRKIFELFFYYDLPIRVIAERLSLAEQTVRNQKARATRLLSSAILKQKSICNL